MLNLVDIIALLVILLNAAVGWWRGLSGEVGRLIGAAAATYLGIRFNGPIGDWIMQHTRVEGEPARALGFVGVVLVVLAASLLLSLAAGKLLKLAMSPATDKIGGATAGGLKGALYAALGILLLLMWPNDYFRQHVGEESLFGRTLDRVTPHLRRTMEDLRVTDRVRETVRETTEDVRRLVEKEEPPAQKKGWFR